MGKKLEEGLAVNLRKFLGEFSEHALVFFSESSPRRRGNGTVSSRRVTGKLGAGLLFPPSSAAALLPTHKTLDHAEQHQKTIVGHIKSASEARTS